MRQYTQYRSTAQKAWDEPFECASCDYRGNVSALGHGVGSAQRDGWVHGFVASETDEARKAQQDADAGAYRAAMMATTLAPCPKCGTRRPAAHEYRKKTMVVSFVVAAITVGLVCLTRNQDLQWTEGGLGGVITLGYAGVRFFPWATAARAVRFEPGPG